MEHVATTNATPAQVWVWVRNASYAFGQRCRRSPNTTLQRAATFSNVGGCCGASAVRLPPMGLRAFSLRACPSLNEAGRTWSRQTSSIQHPTTDTKCCNNRQHVQADVGAGISGRVSVRVRIQHISWLTEAVFSPRSHTCPVRRASTCANYSLACKNCALSWSKGFLNQTGAPTNHLTVAMAHACQATACLQSAKGLETSSA